MEETSQHISKKFDQELAELHHQVLVMGGIVEEQLDNAMLALVAGDFELAENVIASDYRVNSLEVAIDQKCTQVLVRRQPTARDLRFVIMVIKTINDLERMGDEAVRIARQALDLGQHIPRRNQLLELERMAKHVRDLFRAALDAVARLNLEAALEIASADKSVDREYEGIMRQQLTYMMEDTRCIPIALDMMWSARALERIGDRVRNICQYIAYYVKGEDIRHEKLPGEGIIAE